MIKWRIDKMALQDIQKRVCFCTFKSTDFKRLPQEYNLTKLEGNPAD